MSDYLVQGWLLNPLLWVAVAGLVLLLDLFVVSGVSLAIGVAGVAAGAAMFAFAPLFEDPQAREVGRLMLAVALAWSLFSLLSVVLFRFWLRRGGDAKDPNDYARGTGVEAGDVKTAEVETPGYEDVLKGYRRRLE